MERKLKRSVGKVVCGDTFWGRSKEKKLFLEKIREGANLLLTAQRRMGKTSLMAETAREFGEETICLFVDLQDSENARDAIVDIGKCIYEKYPPIWKNIRFVFGNIILGI
jgi:predicted AAA+ superfamily ATPase